MRETYRPTAKREAARLHSCVQALQCPSNGHGDSCPYLSVILVAVKRKLRKVSGRPGIVSHGRQRALPASDKGLKTSME